ncbi:hypothetical protein HMPREF1292_00493 [Corynebacterium sp. KPL1995]|nr:hypothetical protein HMPREF1292_00493 [Corynebacterium sp. KPL1995]ERS74207.1 hypothetical protein HMPREF1290_00495 [Corynebacterium sp. KPL1989]
MRGENLIHAEVRRNAYGSSPHARGKRCTVGLARPGGGLIPACAGKTQMEQPKLSMT